MLIDYLVVPSPIWSGVGVTKQIPPVPLSPRFFIIVETLVTYWIACSYLTGVPAAQLRGHLSNMNVMQIIFARSKILLTEKLMNGALVTPSPDQRCDFMQIIINRELTHNGVWFTFNWKLTSRCYISAHIFTTREMVMTNHDMWLHDLTLQILRGENIDGSWKITVFLIP